MAEEEGKKKRSLWLKLLLIFVIVAVLGVGGFFGYQYFMDQQDQDPEQVEEEATPDHPEDTEMVELDPFVVNLADPLGRRYLRATIEVETVDSNAAEDLQDKQAQVRDSVLMLLSSKTFEDIRAMDQKIQLRHEIVERLNQVIGQGRVVKVYFTEFVVQ